MIFRSHAETIALNTDLSRDARFLHYILTYAINIDTNSGQITHEQLAEKASMCVRTVIRNIVVLEQAGLITVDRAPKGSKIPNIYHLAGEEAQITLRVGRPATATESKRVPESHPKNDQMTIIHVIDEESAAAKSHEAPSPIRESDEHIQQSHTKPENRVQESRTLKQDSVEMIKENDSDVVVSENFEDIPIFKVEGVETKIMLAWTQQYGVTRLKEVIDALPRQKNVQNVPGWVASALKHGWEFGKKQTQKPKQQYAENDGRRYISGEYGSMLQH